MIHDPLQPLTLGDIGSGKYTTLSFDAINSVLKVTVVSAGVSCEYTFDTQGTIRQDGNDILNSSTIQDAVVAAQNAANAASSSATAAGNARDEAQTAATAATDSANDATNAADLALQYASAPEGTDLPGGGRSAAASAALAADIAVESRNLDIGGNVTGDEIYQPGWLFTERQITAATEVEITIPPDIHVSNQPIKKWGTYRLKNPAGSAVFVPEGGTPVNTASSVNKIAKNIVRYLSSGSPFPLPVSTTINIPAGFTGSLFAIYTGSHAGNPGPATLPVQAVISSVQLPTWTTLRAYPANPAVNNGFDWAVFRSVLSAYAGGDVTVTVNGGDNCYMQGLFLFLVNPHGATIQVQPFFSNTAATAFAATLASVAAQSLCFGVAVQRGISTETSFLNFNANMAAIAGGTGNSNDLPEAGVSNGSRQKNMLFGMGAGVQNADGAFTGQGNFQAATGPGGFLLVSVGPVTGGGSPVTLEFENGIDTLTADNGLAEIWFEPDGRTANIRISPEIP